MHEKLARQKQRGLLRHEKQLYLARLRSEIRASRLPGAATPEAPPGEGPTSSRAHIRALADRFRRPGAEDLWNEDDGPLRRAKRPPTGIASGVQHRQQQLDSGKPRGGPSWEDLAALEQPRPRREPLDRGKGPTLAAFNPRREYLTVVAPCFNLRPLIARGLTEVGNGRRETPLALLNQERLYSVAVRRFGRKWRPDSSDDDDESTSARKRNLRFGKFGASSEEDSEIDESGDTGAIRRRWSSAALRNCDMKKERRVLKSYEEESNDLAGRIRELREEIRNREVLGTERRRYESRGESLLTSKRSHSHISLYILLFIFAV
jgi:hypothetical protein